ESNKLYQRILSQWGVRNIVKMHPQRLLLQRMRKVAAVAVVLLICWSTYVIVFQSDSEERNASARSNKAQAQVLPGSNKARIVFEDGTYQELGEGVGDRLGDSRFFTVGGDKEGIYYNEQIGTVSRPNQVHTLI